MEGKNLKKGKFYNEWKTPQANSGPGSMMMEKSLVMMKDGIDKEHEE